jgi:BlaI family transcriptional regulator, penicillinase repressor
MTNNELNLTPPTASELEILQILWQNGAQTVRFVNDELNKLREVGYTTTLKFMQIMLDKGTLTREIIDRSHIYSPAVSEETTQAQLLRGFTDATFRGSSASLVMRALGNGTASAEDLAKIKAMIAEMENVTRP